MLSLAVTLSSGNAVSSYLSFALTRSYPACASTRAPEKPSAKAGEATHPTARAAENQALKRMY